MTRRILAHWFTGCLLAVAGASAAQAQMQDAFVEPDIGHDMQLFAPVDFDFEGMPIHEESGFFFSYSRLNWCTSGERTVVGQPGKTEIAEQIVRENPLDDLPNADVNGGVVPTPYAVINGIQNGGPNASFAWGDRYELGYFKGGTGWYVGVLDGPNNVTQKAYGFPELAIPNNLPLSQYFPGPGFGDPNFSMTNLTTNPTGLLNGSGNVTTSLHGFGSVHVNFDTPDGYLYGWRDYFVAPDTGQILPAPTTGGPSWTVTTITRNVGGLITTIAIARAADGVIDNLDGDDIHGFALVLGDPDGDGTFDTIIGTITDFDDLHRFNVRFDRFYTRNTSDSKGVEIMRTVDLDNSHLPVKEQRNHFSIGYGARFFQLSDNFSWMGLGDWMGRSYASTSVQNQIVGPQIRAKWTHQRGRVGFDMDGRFVAGYNVQDIGQTGGIGENLNPGGPNSPLFAQPTYFDYGRQANFFSPLAEMRVEGSYQLTSAFALKLGYTAMFADNVTRASQIVQYRLPDMGFRTDQIGKQTVFINGVDFGVEAVY